MPRTKRKRISQHRGSFHIISHTVGDDTWLEDDEKEYFLKLTERFAAGFFVKIHTFCIMGNHFHIMATSLEQDAQFADKEKLLDRYRSIYGKQKEPPAGSYDENGDMIPDEDGGTERLRNRLKSMSRFVQELKQTFSRWYNKKHNRKGYLWRERFKGVLVEKGEAQLACSAYIDLNPVRAKIVTRPEDYRWSSLGLRVRDPGRANRLLGIFEISKDTDGLAWYREFIYLSGGIKRIDIDGEEKGTISQELVEDVKRCHGKLGIGDRFGYRVKNISEGIAMGTFPFISELQEKYKRKFVRPRCFLDGHYLFATRVLRL